MQTSRRTFLKLCSSAAASSAATPTATAKDSNNSATATPDHRNRDSTNWNSGEGYKNVIVGTIGSGRSWAVQKRLVQEMSDAADQETDCLRLHQEGDISMEAAFDEAELESEAEDEL